MIQARLKMNDRILINDAVTTIDLWAGVLSNREAVSKKEYKIPIIKNLQASILRYQYENLNTLLATTQLEIENRERYIYSIYSGYLQGIRENLANKRYEKAKERIIEISNNQEDVFAPNQTACEMALEALKLLWDYKVLPSLINPSGDESLLFEFFMGNDFYLIEFYNSGEIIYLKRIVGKPKVIKEIDFQNLKDVIQEIISAYRNANV